MGQKVPHVTILLASYNGEKFIEEQLQSILEQDHKDWSLIVSDDGSTDCTTTIVKRIIDDNPTKDIQLVAGPRRGSNVNFQSLLQYVLSHSDFVAFADQDDVWFPFKIARAVAKLSAKQGPALYGSASIVVDHSLRRGKHPTRRTYVPSFQNALVQNIYAGNSCVLNKSGFELVKQMRTCGVMFDWFLYQLLAGAGGELIYDTEPSLIYRQHGRNQIGANQGWAARFNRFKKMQAGKYRLWNLKNVKVLLDHGDLLTLENKKRLFGFRLLQRVTGIHGLLQLKRLKLFRQTPLGQLGLYYAAIFGKI